MSELIDIGYVCRHGHFQFHDDPDGDACGTTSVGRIYVERGAGIASGELQDAVECSLTSIHDKIEYRRSNA